MSAGFCLIHDPGPHDAEAEVVGVGLREALGRAARVTRAEAQQLGLGHRREARLREELAGPDGDRGRDHVVDLRGLVGAVGRAPLRVPERLLLVEGRGRRDAEVVAPLGAERVQHRGRDRLRSGSRRCGAGRAARAPCLRSSVASGCLPIFDEGLAEDHEVGVRVAPVLARRERPRAVEHVRAAVPRTSRCGTGPRSRPRSTRGSARSRGSRRSGSPASAT